MNKAGQKGAMLLRPFLAVTLLLRPFLAVTLLLATPAPAARHTVTSVHDGDTFSLARRVAPWGLALSVRINGIDTPEAAPKAQCPREAEAADAAKWHLRALIAAAGSRVTLTKVRHDKYGGRINARAFARIGIHDVDLGAAMIAAGHARPNDGGARRSWCR